MFFSAREIEKNDRMKIFIIFWEMELSLPNLKKLIY